MWGCHTRDVDRQLDSTAPEEPSTVPESKPLAEPAGGDSYSSPIHLHLRAREQLGLAGRMGQQRHKKSHQERHSSQSSEREERTFVHRILCFIYSWTFICAWEFGTNFLLFIFRITICCCVMSLDFTKQSETFYMDFSPVFCHASVS